MRNKNRIIITIKTKPFFPKLGKASGTGPEGPTWWESACPAPHPDAEEPGAPWDNLTSPGECLDITLDPARDRSTDTGSFTHRKMGLWVAERGELKRMTVTSGCVAAEKLQF